MIVEVCGIRTEFGVVVNVFGEKLFWNWRRDIGDRRWVQRVSLGADLCVGVDRGFGVDLKAVIAVN